VELADAAFETQAVERALHDYLDALVAQDRDSLRQVTTEDIVLIENGIPWTSTGSRKPGI